MGDFYFFLIMQFAAIIVVVGMWFISGKRGISPIFLFVVMTAPLIFFSMSESDSFFGFIDLNGSLFQEEARLVHTGNPDGSEDTKEINISPDDYYYEDEDEQKDDNKSVLNNEILNNDELNTGDLLE